MKKHFTILINILYFFLIINLYAKDKSPFQTLFRNNSPDWVQTNGPPGGHITDIVFTPTNPSILYAAGSSQGIYKSIDFGENWNLLEFTESQLTQNIEIDPTNSLVLYSNYDGLSKSVDGALSWQNLRQNINFRIHLGVFKIDPSNSNNIYVAGGTDEQSGVLVLKSEDGGLSWKNITGNLSTPAGSGIQVMAIQGSGKIFIGVNDRNLQTWHNGKVFYTKNDGQTWQEIDFGQTEDRFIWSILVNPAKTNEVWISEGPLYNESISQPFIYNSQDGGKTWIPIYSNASLDATQIRVIGASCDGTKVFIAGGGLCYTTDAGKTFHEINLPQEILRSDLVNIAVHPGNSDILFLPTGPGGVAFSDNGGYTWVSKNNGILNTSINLLAADPLNPSVIYATSSGGEGTFRTDDYGESWIRLNEGGICHPWSDEIIVDPVDPTNIWYVSDVPYIHKSTDRGNSWTVLNMHGKADYLNFCSVYALAQSSNNNIIYGLNNGFGIFKGIFHGENNWEWRFLKLSEIDYSYTLVVHPQNSDIIYSGYNPKPFQDWAMIRKSIDGGETWETSIHVPESYGITSIAMDPQNLDILYAGSTGKQGQIYKSDNGGQTWVKLNEHFIMCTVWGQPQLIMHPDDESIVYAATWLGGTWKTEDAGLNWELLDQAPISSTALSFNKFNPAILYLADRTTPTVWKTSDAGNTWQKVADFKQDGALLVMRVVTCGNTVFASTFHHGLRGGKLYKSTDGGMNWQDIAGTLPKGILDIAIDPINTDIIYVTTNINGAHKSIDGGSTWIRMINFPDVGAYDIEIDPNNTETLFISCRGGSLPAWFTQIAGDRPDGIVFQDKAGVYKSTDNGQTWTQLLETTASCRAVRQHPDQLNLLFAVDLVDGLMVSIDGGNNWTDKNEGLDTKVLTSCVVGGNKILVGTQGCGVYSGDLDVSSGVISWQSNRSNKPIPTVHNLQIEVDPKNSNRIFVGSNPGGNYRSDDGGNTFRDVNGITPSVVVDDPVRQGYYTFAINPSNPEEGWVGTWGKGIYKSYNALSLNIPAFGNDMQMVNKHIYKIIIDPTQANTVYAATLEGVYKTTDGGDNWSEINQGLTCKDVPTLLLNTAGELYAGTKGNGLFKLDNNRWQSQNEFGQWGVIWPIWGDRPMYQYTSILIHPQDNQKMLIGTFPQGIYKSTDGGITWKESNVGWSTDGVFTLVCHPKNPEIIYAGTYNGVNRSLDFGEHWEMWDNGWLPEQWVFSIDFDPANPDIMYACSKNGENEGSGRDGFRGTVMKSIDGGANWFEITNGLRHEHEGLYQEFYKIIVDYFDPNMIYLAAQVDGMFISNDGGASWLQWNEGLTNHIPGTNGNNVTNTLVMSADHSILYFGSAGSGVFRRMITPVLPVNNLCADVKNHQIILKWQFDDLNNNFSHYNIYKSTTYFTNIEGLSPYATISNVNDTTFIDNNVDLCVQYYYTVTTVSKNGYENDHIYVLGPVVDFEISIIKTALDTGIVGEIYSDTLQAQGGSPPYIWKIVDNVLPAGLNLDDSTGVICGIPIISGSYNFTVKVTDSHPQPYFTTQQLSLIIITPVSVNVNESKIPDQTFLYQNYPNPFNNQTIIRYQLNGAGHVSIKIFDILGRKIRSLIDVEKTVGYYQIVWDGRDDQRQFVGSGTYFYEMRVGDFMQKCKVLLLK